MPDDHLQPTAVLETAVYCEDLDAAERFYRGVLGLQVMGRESGRHVFFRCGHGVVLVFNPTATESVSRAVNGAAVPRHGARGPGHLAFRLPEAAFERWRDHLSRLGVSIESEVRWPCGGHSLYFRDPAGNSVELATAATWGLPETS